VTPKDNIAMVFGVFDRLHPGHVDFLRQAKEHGDKLIAVVTGNEIAVELKKKKPNQSENERLEAVENVDFVDHSVLGDHELGSYAVIKKYKPDIICLGYDQHALKEDLEERMKRGFIPRIRLVYTKPHRSEEFHTSIMNS